MVKLATISLCVALASCATAPTGPISGVYIERPELPVITQDEALQIPQHIWRKLVERDLLRKQYAEKLEIVVQECTGGMAP